ncbi:MAG TPA: hypothetical protein VFU30_01325 [Gaiellaceae bacterium]|nr:hypothetical protein [Gaiellaceae bacterium]
MRHGSIILIGLGVTFAAGIAIGLSGWSLGKTALIGFLAAAALVALTVLGAFVFRHALHLSVVPDEEKTPEGSPVGF